LVQQTGVTEWTAHCSI